MVSETKPKAGVVMLSSHPQDVLGAFESEGTSQSS